MCLDSCVRVCHRGSVYLHWLFTALQEICPNWQGHSLLVRALHLVETQTSKSALCLTKRYSSRPPSVIINGGAKIINASQIHRAMIEVTAQIGKLFLLAQHFFCLCCCLSLSFVLIVWSVPALVHTAVVGFFM